MNIIVAILILGVIVTIHELGHFLLAKKNGITVTEFSIGMGPRIASYVYKGTRYSLKILPFGGSCMMLGEDETVDDEGAFHKKGPWARFSVIFAGAFFNFIFAFVLSLIYLGNVGVDKPFVENTVKGSPVDGVLQEGDLITKMNGSAVHFGSDIMYNLYFKPYSKEVVPITFVRDGKEQTVNITPVLKDFYLLGCNFYPSGDPAKIVEISADYPVAQAGLEVGDVVINVNGTDIASGLEFSNYLEANPLEDKPLKITYIRDGNANNPVEVTVTPKYVKSDYMTGLEYNLRYGKVSALEVIEYSFYQVKQNIVNTLKSVFYLVTGRVSVKEIAGPVGIVNYVGDIVTESKDYGIRVTLLSLVQFSILISANLGVMNLLPLPALDGGRLVFILIEAVRRKPVAKEKEAMVHMVGMVLLMMLMVFVLFNDIKNIFIR